MKIIKNILLTAICFCNIIASAQSTNNSSNQIPINADQSAYPPPAQNNPTLPPTTSSPINKVILRSQVDSMGGKKRTAPPASQKVYTDSTRHLIYQGDTATLPNRQVK